MNTIPKVKELVKQYADRGLVVVAPSLDAEQKVRDYKTKHGIEYPLLADARKTAGAYGVTGYPTIVLVDKDDKVVWTGHHPVPELNKAIEAALAR